MNNKERLYRSVAFGIVLTVLSPFMGWLRWPSTEHPGLPIWLQLMRHFGLGFASHYLVASALEWIVAYVRARN